MTGETLPHCSCGLPSVPAPDARRRTALRASLGLALAAVGALTSRFVYANELKLGKPAPPLVLHTLDGQSIATGDLLGQVVIVTFWASWCGPCRKENPNVVAMYKKYHAKGFEIFGVSLDDNKEKWMKAVEADGLVWNHVSDLRAWENAAAKLYGVTSIPFALLLDKEGKIVAKDLRGAELDTKIAETLAAK